MKPTYIKHPSRDSRGFSLLEVIATVAILGVIAAVAIPYAFRSQQEAQELRLQNAVGQLNQSLKIYLASGGSVAGMSDGQAVVDKLKTRRDAGASARFVGFSGAMADDRLQVVSVPEGQLESKRLRAVWNAEEGRFELTREPVEGIADFALLEASGSEDQGTEERAESVVSFNTRNGWIWEYTDATGGERGTPSRVELTGTEPTGGPGTMAGGGEGMLGGTSLLSPPVFSMTSGYYPLGDFSLPVTLSNPNPDWETQIYFRTGREGSYQPYGGQPIEVGLDERVYAYVKSLNRRRYRDSQIRGEHYDGAPVELELELTAEETEQTYFDLVDGKGHATARIANLGDIPGSFRDGLRISWAFGEGAAAGGEYGEDVAGQLIMLSPSAWGGEGEAQLTALASGEGPYLKTSEPQTLSFAASVLTLDAPVIEAVQERRGKFEITLLPGGRTPQESRIFYTTDGEDPLQSEETGEVSGTLYEGPFQLELEKGPADGVAPYPATSGPVSISRVVLRSNGNSTVTQNSPVTGRKVNNSQNRTLELREVSVVQNGQSTVLSNLNTIEVTISNLVYPDSSQDVSIYRGGSRVAWGSQATFAAQLQSTLRSSNLRDYVDFGMPASNEGGNFFSFDMAFAPVSNGDFLVVAERNGDQALQLTPLGPNGQLIPGANTVTVDSYLWNTGYAPSDKKTEPMVLGVVDVEAFGVNTDLMSITGFRVTTQQGADFKLYTASDTTFAERTVKEKVTYLPKTVVARVYPPEALGGWFEPSAAVEAEIRDETETVRVQFTSLASSAGYLNKATLFVNGEAYDFGDSDMGAGNSLFVDIEVNPYATNRFDLAIDTWMRHGDWISGLDTRDGTGFDLIGVNDTFQGASDYVAKIKDLSYDSQIHMIVGFEDLIKTGGTPDWDYDDFLFEVRADEAFSFQFGGQYLGSQSGGSVGSGIGSGNGSGNGNGQSNNGHGNNADGVDSSNPGQGVGGPTGANNSGNDPSGGYDDEMGGGNGNGGGGNGGGGGSSGGGSGSSSQGGPEEGDDEDEGGTEGMTVNAPGNHAISNVIFYFQNPNNGQILRVKWDSVGGEVMSLGFDFANSAYAGQTVIGYSVKAGANSGGPNGEGTYVAVSGSRPGSWSQYIETTYAAGLGQGVITVLATK